MMGRGSSRPGNAQFGFTVSRRMQVFEDTIANSPRESAAAFDADGNQIGNVVQGNDESVDMTELVNTGRLAGAVVTHNHPPRSADSRITSEFDSFSPQDIMFAARNDVAAIRARTGAYTFTAERPANGWPSVLALKTAYAQREIRIVRRVQQRVQNGASINDAIDAETREFIHLDNREVASQFGIRYTRQRGGRRT